MEKMATLGGSRFLVGTDDEVESDASAEYEDDEFDRATSEDSLPVGPDESETDESGAKPAELVKEMREDATDDAGKEDSCPNVDADGVETDNS